MRRLVVVSDNYLAHHGIKGQKWGVRKEDDERELNRIRSLHKEDVDYQKNLNNEELRLQKQIDKRDKKIAKEKRSRRIRNVIFGTVLSAIGVNIVANLLSKRFGKQQNASEAIKNNAAAISKGKEYVTGYKNVPVFANYSSRAMGVKNYMGKKAKYNITF